MIDDSKLRDDLAEQNAAHEPTFCLQMNEDQCREVSFGRVPGEIQELAKTLVDWTMADLRRNAAKPVRLAKAAR